MEPNAIPPRCAGADPNPKKPSFTPPPGSCDCHSHVLWPQSMYSYVPNRSYTPPEANLSSYQHMLSTLGLDRAVIVHPSVYGTDNRATLEAIKKGGKNFRGVAVVDEDIDFSELEDMHQAGIRGVRINLLFEGGIGMSGVKKLTQKVAPLGWHLQVLIDVSEFDELDTLGDLPVDVVFDHMGHMPTAKGLNDPGFVKMLKMLERGHAWVKLSGAYRISGHNNLPYNDVVPFAQQIIKTNPENLVWATDWPHPSVNVPMPNDGDLLDLLLNWAPDEQTRNRILVDNPSRLYDF
ncbi:MAG: amidohydrolase family protein [Desulfuromonadales bacterium]|nr:amidohydrolase family protein [Desulfuromonadales bacterium]MBN2791356.1 amidohydrolase family protein [Desulfuromonadales bacterium]